MTSQEWDASTDIAQMLLLVRHTSERKLRLFAEACSGICDCAGVGKAVWLRQVSALNCLWADMGCKATPAIVADILRHVFGDPFRPPWSEKCWRCKGKKRLESPATEGGFRSDKCSVCHGKGHIAIYMPADVVRLAEAVCAGEDCAFALHDALIEAGAIDLAEHFSAQRHPRGCWALDLVLGLE